MGLCRLSNKHILYYPIYLQDQHMQALQKPIVELWLYYIYSIMYVLKWGTVDVLTRVSFVYFPTCEATREINTKITLK